jgi:hypothetical protein
MDRGCPIKALLTSAPHSFENIVSGSGSMPRVHALRVRVDHPPEALAPIGLPAPVIEAVVVRQPGRNVDRSQRWISAVQGVGAARRRDLARAKLPGLNLDERLATFPSSFRRHSETLRKPARFVSGRLSF